MKQPCSDPLIDLLRDRLIDERETRTLLIEALEGLLKVTDHDEDCTIMCAGTKGCRCGYAAAQKKAQSALAKAKNSRP